MSTILTEELRTALEDYVSNPQGTAGEVRAYQAACRELAKIGVYSSSLEFARWLIDADNKARISVQAERRHCLAEFEKAIAAGEKRFEGDYYLDNTACPDTIREALETLEDAR